MNLCVIPARGGSKRIPRKNIRDFCGKPMIASWLGHLLWDDFRYTQVQRKVRVGITVNISGIKNAWPCSHFRTRLQAPNAQRFAADLREATK